MTREPQMTDRPDRSDAAVPTEPGEPASEPSTEPTTGLPSETDPVPVEPAGTDRDDPPDLGGPADPADPAAARPRWRRVAAGGLTALAIALILFALIAPNDINRYSPGAFLRIPVEGLLAAVVIVGLPRAGRVVAAVFGVLLGLLTLLKIFDLGFFAVLYRPFDPVLDWAFVEAGVDYVSVTVGKGATIAAVVGAVLAGIALPVLTALAAVRLARILGRHRTGATRSLAAVCAVWVICALLGVQLVHDQPVAAKSVIDYAALHARQVPDGIRDAREFSAEVTVDAFRDIPGNQLLTALRGKDVVLTFVESYGRAAIEDPQIGPEVSAVLDAGTSRLRAAGFDSRSAFLTSSTYGGGSWLAHSTLESGLWINNQKRYRNLVTTDRLTLTRAFANAGWHTVGVEPAVIQAWPEGKFFGYNSIYTASELGYQGTRYSYATMPDQYIFSAFQRLEHGKPGHAPLMAQIVTLSSHAPWSPVPKLIGWNDVGNGSVFDTPAGTDAPPESIYSRDSSRVRTDYRRSIEYALNNLISYVETYGDDNLVLIFLGDHQPATVVSGENATHDVPITIVAKDKSVLDRVSGWGWQDGLKPGPQAPVWRMDTFRNRFLTTFSPAATPKP